MDTKARESLEEWHTSWVQRFYRPVNGYRPTPIEREVAETAFLAGYQARSAQDKAALAEAREALLYVRHRDARWHDDEVVTPAIATLDKLMGDA